MLMEAGFEVSYSPVCYEPAMLWSAKASRDEREWSATGACIRDAFIALEKEMTGTCEHWRQFAEHEIAAA
jgi:hypothetical protein